MDFQKKEEGPTPYCNYPGSQYANKKALGDYDVCPGCDDGGKSCPLGVLHPMHGIEYCLGCSQCQVLEDRWVRAMDTIEAMVGPALRRGYAHRVPDRTDAEGAERELAACMLLHGATAVARGELSPAVALDWLKENGVWRAAWDDLGQTEDAFRVYERTESDGDALEPYRAGPSLLVLINAFTWLASACLSKDTAPRLEFHTVIKRPEFCAVAMQARFRGRRVRRLLDVGSISRACRLIQRTWRGCAAACQSSPTNRGFLPCAMALCSQYAACAEQMVWSLPAGAHEAALDARASAR
jgi:ferredoxin